MKYLTSDEQKQLLTDILTKSEHPFEDAQNMFYQIEYDIINHLTYIDEAERLNIKRVVFNDIIQIGMALSNIRFFGDKHPELKEEVRALARRIIEIAAQVVGEHFTDEIK